MVIDRQNARPYILAGVLAALVGVVIYRNRAGPAATAVIAAARAQIGKPYKWGATGPDEFDCSGLMWSAWGTAGKRFRRTTAAGLFSKLRPIARAALQPGDMVFYGASAGTIHHVGLYIGNGQMIHAPSTGKNVTVGRVDGMRDFYSGGRW